MQRGRPRKGDRALGPYGRRVVFLLADGSRFTQTFATKAKAAIVAASYNEAAQEVTEDDTDSAIAAYRIYLEAKGNKPKSIDQTEWAVSSFFAGNHQLYELSAPVCRKLYAELVARPLERTGQPPAVDSHRGILAQAKTFLTWGVEQGWLKRNPAAEVRGVGRRNKGKAQLSRPQARKLWQLVAERSSFAAAHEGTSPVRNQPGTPASKGRGQQHFDSSEVRSLGGDTAGPQGRDLDFLRASHFDPGAAAVWLAMHGLRASEITGLRVGHFDDEAVYVARSTTKTDKGERAVAVAPELAAVLLAMAAGTADGELIFGHHDRDWPRHQAKRLCKLAKVPVVTAHGLRGTLATLALNLGVAAREVADTLGHDDVRTTKTSYAKAGAGDVAEQRRMLTVIKGGK